MDMEDCLCRLEHVNWLGTIGSICFLMDIPYTKDIIIYCIYNLSKPLPLSVEAEVSKTISFRVA